MEAVPRNDRRYTPGTILGSYRLDEVLGTGGMGIVYVATHTRLDRRVAIKVLRREYAGDPQALHQFFAEARAINKIAHPNIIEVTDFVEQPGADNYYVMELLEGGSLADLVDAGGILELPRSIAIMTQVAEALGAVHRAGIVHRDLKPQNVVLIERGGKPDFVKLVDFGIAKFDSAPGKKRPADSDTEMNFGTPKYMSPEQARGESVDYRSDIFTFGVMLFELVTGRAPEFGANHDETAANLRTGGPHAIPRLLEDLILWCLAEDPNDRPARIEQVAARLVEIADENNWIVYELSLAPSHSGRLPTPAPDARAPELPTSPPVALPPSRAVRIGLIVAVGVACGAIAIVAVLMLGGGGSGNNAPSASLQAKVDAEVAIADQRIAEGRLVAPGGDEALDHLLAARTLDPTDRAVHDRLEMIARKFEQLADQALQAGSLVEAAAHLQTVLLAEPTNTAVAAKMNEIEEKILQQQRTNPRR